MFLNTDELRSESCSSSSTASSRVNISSLAEAKIVATLLWALNCVGCPVQVLILATRLFLPLDTLSTESLHSNRSQ